MAKSAPDRVGIFGGSFNPVHRGHLALARYASDALNLGRVIFVPSFHTPLKKKTDLLPAELRWRCLTAALKCDRALEASAFEIRRGKKTYTVETLSHFKRKFGPRTTLYFLAGADTTRHLSRWKSPDKVIKLCRFVVCSRPGHTARKAPKGLCYLPFPALDISASEIRRRLAKGQGLKGLVEPAVEKILTQYQRKVRIGISKTKRK